MAQNDKGPGIAFHMVDTPAGDVELWCWTVEGAAEVEGPVPSTARRICTFQTWDGPNDPASPYRCEDLIVGIHDDLSVGVKMTTATS